MARVIKKCFKGKVSDSYEVKANKQWTKIYIHNIKSIEVEKATTLNNGSIAQTVKIITDKDKCLEIITFKR